jgi:hypothetical protein
MSGANASTGATADIFPRQTTNIRNDVHNESDVPRPEEKPRGKGMSDGEFQNFVYQQASEAKLYMEQHLLLARTQATDYYKGRLPDVDPEDFEEDRSKAVLTEVRDTTLGMLPDLLRIFFGSSEGVIEYRPIASEDPQTFQRNQLDAKNATSYVQNVVLKVDNPTFFMTMHSVFKDAIVRKTGFVTWYWQEYERPDYSTYTGLDQETLMALAADEEIEIVDKSPIIDNHTQAVTYEVTTKRVRKDGRVKITGVPCENMLVNGNARDEDDAMLVGYTDEMEAGEFVARGIVDDIKDLDGCDWDPQDRENPETIARRPGGVSLTMIDHQPPTDPSRRKIKYGELYVRCDYDGDGIDELRHVITAGTRFKIFRNEPADEINFAAFCPYPEAYQFFGDSVADLTMDIQRIKSRILRDTLDSLAQSVKPQMGVVEGQVNLDDVLNPDTSNVIRQRAPGMIQPITIPFVGKEAFPVLDYMTTVREARTGMTDAAAGLDAKQLQSTDNDAVQNTLTKGEGRIEYVARMFIETGFKRLFRGVLHLIKKHQSTPRVVELNGQIVKIDPRWWNAEMHVEPTPILGRGGTQGQIAALTGILQKQEMIMQTLGPINPFVTIGQYYNTLRKLCEAIGQPNVSSFFTDPSSLQPPQLQQIIQAMQQAMAQAQQGGGQGGGQRQDPQIEQAKIQSHEKIEAAKLQSKQQEAVMHLRQHQIDAHSRMEAEILKSLLTRETTLDTTKINALVAHAGQRLNALVDHHANLLGAAVDHHDNMTDAAVQHAGNQMSADTAVQVAKMKPKPNSSGGSK